jgi:hypothetical protein
MLACEIIVPLHFKIYVSCIYTHTHIYIRLNVDVGTSYHLSKRDCDIACERWVICVNTELASLSRYRTRVKIEGIKSYCT